MPTFRTLQNVPGVVYDETKLSTIFAEDINAIHEAINNIEVGEGSSPIIMVAAENANTLEKAASFLVCDGTDDHVQINNAIDLVRSIGGKIKLSSGDFNLGDEIDLRGETAESDDNPMIYLQGQGIDTTTLIGANNKNVIKTGRRSKFVSGAFTIIVKGSGDGINQVAGTERGNWQSTFHDIFIKSDFVAPTGWGINMQSPFRMRFVNIEMNGVANGCNLTTHTSSFNPGNLSIDRMFIDLWNDASNSNAVGFRLGVSGSSATETMNLVFVSRLDIYGGSNLTNSIGVLIEGANESYGDSRQHTFVNLNIEDVKTPYKLIRGRDCTFIDINYTRALDGGTVFDLDSNSQNNRFENVHVASNANSTITVINDQNNNSSLPNSFERITGWAGDNTEYNFDLKPHTIVRRVDLTGGSPTINDLVITEVTGQSIASTLNFPFGTTTTNTSYAEAYNGLPFDKSWFPAGARIRFGAFLKQVGGSGNITVYAKLGYWDQSEIDNTEISANIGVWGSEMVLSGDISGEIGSGLNALVAKVKVSGGEGELAYPFLLVDFP